MTKRFSHPMMRAMALCVALVCSVIPTYAASIDEMAGQMILTGFQGNSIDSKSVQAVQEQLRQGKIGGVMFLKTNVASLAAVKQMNAAFTSASNGLPPFIALDQEGGSIERLTSSVGFKEIPSAERIAAQGDIGSAEAIYSDMARDISALGFNLNFGPVVDVDVNPNNPIIARYGRSFGRDPSTVADYATAFVAGHRKAGVLTALKHFPGHGSSADDSHKGFVDITKSWLAEELDPYRVLVARGLADMVMVGHLFHAKFVTDTDAQPPASLSPSWITGVLRQQVGFDGVVISDDMEMSAIRSHFGFRDAIVRAVMAGTDILLFSNTADYRIGLADEIRAVMVAEAASNPAFLARMKESYARIVALKSRLVN